MVYVVKIVRISLEGNDNSSLLQAVEVDLNDHIFHVQIILAGKTKPSFKQYLKNILTVFVNVIQLVEKMSYRFILLN